MEAHFRDNEELRALFEHFEQRISHAEQRATNAGKRAANAEKVSQKTTFAEFLEACHRFISKPLCIVETDKSLTTKGSITSPAGRICPTFLKPWDFHSAQQPLFDEVYQLFQTPSSPPMRVFPSVLVIEDRGNDVCSRPLASELDLARHQNKETETPVKEVMRQLAQLPAAQRAFPLAQGVTFENHLRHRGARSRRVK